MAKRYRARPKSPKTSTQKSKKAKTKKRTKYQKFAATEETSKNLADGFEKERDNFEKAENAEKLSEKVAKHWGIIKGRQLHEVQYLYVIDGDNVICCQKECADKIIFNTFDFRPMCTRFADHNKQYHRCSFSINRIVAFELEENKKLKIRDKREFVKFLAEKASHLVCSKVWTRDHMPKWIESIKNPRPSDDVKVFEDGKKFHEWFDQLEMDRWKRCIVLMKSDGLGAHWPPVRDLLNTMIDEIGTHPVDGLVRDNATYKKMTVTELINRYNGTGDLEELPVNVLSLEVSHNKKLCELLKGPNFVRDFCMTDYLKQSVRPKDLENYIIISMKGCFTDFHIDYVAVTTHFHVLSGVKIFFLLPPTPENLKKFEAYRKDKYAQKNVDWLGNDKKIKGQICKVELTAGKSFIMPAGWIHAVHTAENSLSYAGSFMNKECIRMQIKIFEQEKRMNTPKNQTVSEFFKCNVEYLNCILTKEVERNNLADKNMKNDPKTAIVWDDFLEISSFVGNKASADAKKAKEIQENIQK